MPVTRLLIALIPACAVAAGNWIVAGMIAPGTPCVACLAWLVGAPVVLALLLLTMLGRIAPPPPGEPTVTFVPTRAEPDETPALRLLGMLQEGGRFVDFVQEDLAPYPDEQIGAAVRSIHDGCRKALGEHVVFEPVLRGNEGETVTVEPGFDPAAIRLTGNASGAPPFRGVLRHTGWRAVRAALPPRPGADPHLIAPAEVEIP
ncbi:MAG TPA: DUF2760 domain-containing protein [Solirubrobacteraceae bacterium]|jgi:hypothetical protein